MVRAREAHLADLSDVALLKRLKKSKAWLHALCVRLFEEQELAVVPGGAFQVRAVDATTVKEPGPSGSLWRLHYSVCLPSLACDFFKLTGTEGPGTGESLAQFPIRAGDHVLADRGYSTARGIHHVVDAGGRLIVRVNTAALPLFTASGRPFDLLAAVASVTRPGAVRSWATRVVDAGGDGGATGAVAGRVCVLRKSAEAIRLAHPKNSTGRCSEGPRGATGDPAIRRVRDRLHDFFPSRLSRPQTCWTGIEFGLNQVKRAIEPPLPLAGMINNWRTISHALAEPPRRRQQQLPEYFDWAEPLEDQVIQTS